LEQAPETAQKKAEVLTFKTEKFKEWKIMNINGLLGNSEGVY
jgi:hypothetical protein